MTKEKTYLIWVGGAPACDYPVYLDMALELKSYYLKEGYDDVVIEEY